MNSSLPFSQQLSNISCPEQVLVYIMEIKLAQQENLLVPDDWTQPFFGVVISLWKVWYMYFWMPHATTLVPNYDSCLLSNNTLGEALLGDSELHQY